MLVHKDNPLTEYKPYTEHILELPQYELPKLPNGVADEIDLTNKTYIKRVGKIVIDGSQEVAQYQANSVGGTYAFFVTIPNYKNKSNTDYAPNILADRLPTLGGETVWNITYPCVAPYTNGRIVVRDYFLNNAVADAKAYLAQNPITLWFELDEPIIEPLDKDYDATYPAWNYGLEQVDSIAQFDIEYELDVVKQGSTNTEIVQRNENRLASSESRLDEVENKYIKNQTSYSNAVAIGNDLTIDPRAISSITIGDGAYNFNSSNIAIGTAAVAGDQNDLSSTGAIAIGTAAYGRRNCSIAIGWDAYANGAVSTALGYEAQAHGSNSTALGYDAQVSESENFTIRLGSTILSSLKCAVALTVSSDERDKADITEIPDDKALEFIKNLKPIQYVRNPREYYELPAQDIEEYEVVETVMVEKEITETVVDKNGVEQEITKIVKIPEQRTVKKQRTVNKKKELYGLGDYDKEAHARGEKKGTRKRVGFSAQQIEQLVQNIFGTDNYADLVYDNFYDLSEKPTDAESQKTVAYEKLIPFLVAAMQEQQRQIDELKARIEALGKDALPT